MELIISGSTCWGHVTDVLEDNVRTFVDNWTGTGEIENVGAGDTERLALETGEYMIGELVETGEKKVTLLQSEYRDGDAVLLQYRHGATSGDCQSADWNDYTDPFQSLGYVQIKVTSTL